MRLKVGCRPRWKYFGCGYVANVKAKATYPQPASVAAEDFYA